MNDVVTLPCKILATNDGIWDYIVVYKLFTYLLRRSLQIVCQLHTELGQDSVRYSVLQSKGSYLFPLILVLYIFIIFSIGDLVVMIINDMLSWQ